MIGSRRALLSKKTIIAAADSAQALAFLARTSGLDGAHIAHYKALINGLVLDGVWTKLDTLYIFATQTQATALLNLVSSSFNASLISAPAFTADAGFAGINGTQFVDTNFNASTAGGLYGTNSAHMMLWGNAATVGDGNCQVIANAANGSHIYARFSGDTNAYFRINCTSAAGASVASAHGFYLGNRSGGSAWQGYKDSGTALVTGTDAASAPVNGTFTLPAGASGGQTSSLDQFSAFGCGGSLSAADVGNYNSRMRTYMTAVGVP
jgi:hypothetical protein